MAAVRRILIVGGAPLVPVDAVRALTVSATGTTARHLARILAERGVDAELLLSRAAGADSDAQVYATRADLEQALRSWLVAAPDGVVVLSAAINDYEVAAVERREDGRYLPCGRDDKVPSGSEEVVIRLRPAGKIIDQLPGWGHRGPLIGFKYEDAATVVESARRLRERVDADAVVANSLCGRVQALVLRDRIEQASDRAALLQLLADRLSEFSVH